MLKNILKDKYALINELNNTCTYQDLQEIQETLKQLTRFKFNEDKKLEYKCLHSAIISNNLDNYTTFYYNAYKLQEILEEFQDDGFITHFCDMIGEQLSNIEEFQDDLLSFFDNLILNYDFQEYFRYYLENIKELSLQEIDEIIENLGV